MEHIKLDEKDTGLNYRDHSYMVAGWLSDYKLTYDDTTGKLDENGNQILTVNDFKENRGYVDEDGYIYIFREYPNQNELIPWFTVVMKDDGTPKLEFNKRRSEETKKAFRIEMIGNLSVKNIIDTTTEGEVEYDPEVLNDMARATSTFIPEIKDTDDFLKKLIKTAILEKNVNVHKYKKQVLKTYILSNLIQILSNTTRTSPFAFEQWMEILSCDFEIIVHDNGTDKQDPLPHDVIYKSSTGEVIIKEGNSGKEEKSNEKETCMARSARQYH